MDGGVPMYGRRHGGKPTFALWTLVVLADVALVTRAAGPEAVLGVIAGFAAVAAVLTVWVRHRRAAGTTTSWTAKSNWAATTSRGWAATTSRRWAATTSRGWAATTSRGRAATTDWAGKPDWAWHQRTATAHGPHARHTR